MADNTSVSMRSPIKNIPIASSHCSQLMQASMQCNRTDSIFLHCTTGLRQPQEPILRISPSKSGWRSTQAPNHHPLQKTWSVRKALVIACQLCIGYRWVNFYLFYWGGFFFGSVSMSFATSPYFFCFRKRTCLYFPISGNFRKPLVCVY